MNPARSLTACLMAVCLATAATAQLPGPGLTWVGSAGNFAGGHLPSCTNLPVPTLRGEAVEVRVWGDPMAPFALFAAGSGNQCLPIPGLGNALVLDPPLITVVTGVLTQPTPCLSCPPFFHSMTFIIPAGLPGGTALSLQAASFGALQPSFTVAVTATVQ